MTDRLPVLGLAAAALALIALPVWKQYERANAPLIGEGPAAVRAAAAEIDAYWAKAFPEQFPGRDTPYRSPRLRFDDVRGASLGARDDNAGYYIGEIETIHIDVERDPGLETPWRYRTFVLSHEYGHHLQKLVGMQAWADGRRALSFPERNRRLGVRYELQAECFSGVWAKAGVRDGMIAPSDVGYWRVLLGSDHAAQTHGDGDQRRRWFDQGYGGGRAENCDTFSPAWEDL